MSIVDQCPCSDQAGPDARATSGVLLLESDDVDAELILRRLRRTSWAGRPIARARNLQQGLEQLATHDYAYELILADLNLPDAADLEVVHVLVDAAPDCPLIVQSERNEKLTPLELIEAGAQDYLMKAELSAADLDRAIRHAVARHKSLVALRRTQVRLDEATSDLEEFAYVVAHDLRSPVRTSRLLANRLSASVDDGDQRATEFAERLDSALLRVDEMILSILDYAGLGSRRPGEDPVPMMEVAARARAHLAAELDEADGIIVLDGDPTLLATGDAELVERVLLNLFSNGIKYRRPGVAPTVSFAARHVGSRVEFRISDNGVGIDPADSERVFELLERAAPDLAPGLGFGLAICRRIMSNLGGSIDLDIEAASGTTFVLDLPAFR